MSADAKFEALQWQVLQSQTSSAKLWTELARAAALSTTFPDATAKAVAVTTVYERAVRALPYSYKMWTQYVDFRKRDTRALCSANEWFQSVRDVYERAVANLPQMPLLWVSYMEFVMDFPLLRATMVRHVIGRSLSALPATQHHLVWKVVKRWSAHPAVPRGTFRQLWSLYLQLDSSAAAARQYFSLLQRRNDTAEYVRECARLVSQAAAKVEPSPAERRLLEDTAFWEPLLLAFQSPGWFLEEGESDREGTSERARGAQGRTSVDTLDTLVAYGRRYCASSVSMELAYIGFLYGQGYIIKGRQALGRMLDEVADPQTFAEIFAVAVEVEDQVVESFALSETARELLEQDKATYLEAVRGIFGSADPCAHLSQLVKSYPMLVNQAQLRSHPRCVPLWLKRIELLQERVCSAEATPADLVALHLQAIAQCVSGLETVDPAAGQLYHSHALLLCSMGKTQEAADTLHEAAWLVRFSSGAVNAMLLGLLAEVLMLMGTPSFEVAATLLRPLTRSSHAAATAGSQPTTFPSLASGAAARRRRGALLASLSSNSSTVPTSLLISDVRPWLLAADLFRDGAAELTAVAQSYSLCPAYTAEGAVHMAAALWLRCKDKVGATRELERALTRFRVDPVASLFLVQQYLSFLCLCHRDSPGTDFPLHRVRELFRVAEEMVPAALQHVPAGALDLLVTCAFLERRHGLYGNAVRLLQYAAEAATEHLDPAEHLSLIHSVVEKAIRCTQLFKGCPGTRQFCGALLRRTAHAPLLQRIALQWAAIERRCGNREQAYAVLDACGDSQNPATPHGAVYWKLWETLCVSLQDFERLVRRRQQVEVRYQKRQPKPAAVPAPS